ncbi:MAG TPA: alpha/beta fold hydrolase [Pseudonocardiaceae bacterium]|jgi:pimeloyl-ACP methyl ester carboxylesterase|nr:alpha/beta fold hydrolase [Pseudonocardiaceae bacterium]
MKFLFDNESFSFETLRAAGFANYDGADLGEILATTREIEDGDEASWLRAWQATARRVEQRAEQSLAAGHRVSAREALLRASNYYRTAEFFRRAEPATDPEAIELSRRSRATFAAAVALFDTPVHTVTIPYEDTTLPGYLFLVDDSGTARPTVIYNNGYDSTAEESYFAVAAAALRRGYNVLAFDGPGQGAALREQGLVFRPDWEAVLTPVVDFALTRPEIALFGYSLGGYLVARAGAFEHRVAALVLDDGVHDFFGAFERVMPPFLISWIIEGRDEVTNPILAMLAAGDTNVRWALDNGIWAMGADSAADYVRRTRAYTLAGVADRIDCPTLILDAEQDQFFRGQPQELRKALTAPTTLITLTEADGAGEHCHAGAMSQLHREMFDWLDDTLGR